MKDKAAMYFKRLATGEVIGEIITEGGKVVESRNFVVKVSSFFTKQLTLSFRQINYR